MIGRTVGHYRVLSRLGGGGMGVVYKAEDLTLGRHVALKLLPPELTRDDDARKRFLREARAASQLDHPNICTVHEIGETDGQTWIAMGFYDGETLKARVERGVVEPGEAIGLAIQIARGLGKAHASGIVHRDIKPANVMVTREGVAKIVDFGLAKLAGATHITQSTQMLGTLAYMAPEQLRGETVGPQADLWALGATLFEVLTGAKPFRGENSQAMAYGILNEQPASLLALRPEVPPALERIVKKLLRKDPLQRYQTAEEVIAELELLLGSGSGSGSGKKGSRGEETRELLRSGAKLGPYEIVEPLGSGGMGDVYRARDTRLARQVAVKVLAPEFSEDAERRQRFQREAKTISSLSHANICTLFDVGEQEGTDFLVMEFLEGETLAARLGRAPLKLNELLKIGVQIAEALGRAHQQGVIHRDLKPANVMLTSSGVVKLVDFGLAKGIAEVLEGNGSRSERRRPRPVNAEDVTEKRESTPSPEKPLTAEGAIVGTLPYMAPEQVEGREADARSDIFALGAILYEMATGRRAFEGATKASLVAAILTSEPSMLSEVARSSASASGIGSNVAAIEHIVRQCLEKDPDRRWQSALDVSNAMRWVGDRQARAIPDGRSAPRSWLREHRAAVISLAASLGLIAFAGGWAARNWDDQRRTAKAELPKPIPDLRRLTAEAGAESEATVSPDGGSFAYVSAPKGSSGNSDILVRRVGGENAINLTRDCMVNDSRPAFSPDGKFIAFRSERDGGGVFIMGATGESVRRLTDYGYDPSWSPDGKSIAIIEGDNSYGWAPRTLWVVDVASNSRRKLFEGTIWSVRWSPSGHRLAFTLQVTRSGRMGDELYTISVDGGEAVAIPTKRDAVVEAWARDGIWYRSPAGEGDAIWQGDAIWKVRASESTGEAIGVHELVMQAPSARSVSPARDGRSVLFTSGVSGLGLLRWQFDAARGTVSAGSPTIVSVKRELFLFFGPSPDGKWLGTMRLAPDPDIVLMRVTDGETVPVTNDAASEFGAGWAPDGSRLYFCIAPAGKGELWSVRADGSGRQLEHPSLPVATNDATVRISSDGQSLWFSAGAPASGNWTLDLSTPLSERRFQPVAEPGPERLFLAEAWSPDGRWMFGYTRTKNGAFKGIILLDTLQRRYREMPAVPIDGLGRACWLPDSRRIILLGQWGREHRVLDTQTGSIVPAGSTQSDGLVMNPYLSGDGRWIYANSWSWESDIWMLDYGAKP